MLSDSKFLDVLKTMLTFAKTFELEYGFPFIEAKTEDIGADLKGSNFLPRASLATCKRHIRVAKTMLRCPEALKFVQDDAPDVFGATHLDDKTLATSRSADTLLLLRAAQHYLQNPDRPKGEFPVHEFYKAGARYVSALRALFSIVRSHNQSLFASSGFDGFLDFEITLSKSSKSKIKVLDVFVFVCSEAVVCRMCIRHGPPGWRIREAPTCSSGAETGFTDDALDQ